MPPYGLIHFEQVLWVLLIGVVLSLAIILARTARSWSFTFKARSEKELEDETHEFPGGVSEQNRPMPIFIWLVIIGYVVWATSYVVFVGANGL